MVRRHGWQLPAHTFQVVAVTVFFLLAVAFYVFLAPFLWFHALEFTALGLYSPLAFAVFLLYIRSSAIDPADPGVFARHPPQSKHSTKPSLSQVSAGIIRADTMPPLSPGMSRSFSIGPADNNFQHKGSPFDQPRVEWQSSKGSQMSLSALCGGVLCWWAVKDDSCKDDSKLEQPMAEEDVLFCTLCNAEVRKYSKHCRSCDKCVDGFDHHCRWLNNCVGKKNYNTFVSLMAASLTLLVLEWGIGMAVLVRCFVDKKALEHQIVEKLGNSYSRAPFATVVAICTLVSLLASIPLGELFFFHLILIRKGITTYEYVVAMRAQNEPQGFSAEGEIHSIPTSPASSTATGLSASSSLGLQYSRGAWCTPPRVFAEHEDEIIPQLGPGRLPSTVDPDLGAATGRNGSHQKKGTVRISAWKLSKLNADEATRAVVKARERSTIFRQLGPRDFGVPERENTSSSNISSRSSLSTDYLSSKGRLKDDSSLGSVKGGLPPVYSIRDDSSIQYDSGQVQAQIRSSLSSPSHTFTDSTGLSPLPNERRYGLAFPPSGIHLSASMTRIPNESTTMVGSYARSEVPGHQGTVLSHSSADFSRAWSGPAASSDGYEASSGESADDGGFPLINRLPSTGSVLPDRTTLSVKEGRRAALFWDRSSEGYGPFTMGTVEGFNGSSSVLSSSLNSSCAWPESSASPHLSSTQIAPEHAPERLPPAQASSWIHDASPSMPSAFFAHDNLVYSGTSIFYGGPMGESPIIIKGHAKELPRTHRANPRGSLVGARAPLASKPPLRSTLRTQSPVFAPRAMLSSSMISPGTSSR